jgi:hypothetical protein
MDHGNKVLIVKVGKSCVADREKNVFLQGLHAVSLLYYPQSFLTSKFSYVGYICISCNYATSAWIMEINVLFFPHNAKQNEMTILIGCKSYTTEVINTSGPGTASLCNV